MGSNGRTAGVMDKQRDSFKRTIIFLGLTGVAFFGLLQIVFNPFSEYSFLALAIPLICVVYLIITKWNIPARGFTQLGAFVMGEYALFCNRGIQCQNCPLSFGFCPIGTIQRLTFIREMPFYFTLAVIGVIGFLFGSLMCGWGCPVGFIQDVFSSAGLKKIRLPSWIGSFRVVSLLVFSVLIFWELGFHALSRNGIYVFSLTNILVGFVVLLTAFFIKRPLCRILCPLGFIYGQMNRFSISRVNIDRRDCVGCGQCKESCVVDSDPRIGADGGECVKCFDCVNVCRKEFPGTGKRALAENSSRVIKTAVSRNKSGKVRSSHLERQTSWTNSIGF